MHAMKWQIYEVSKQGNAILHSICSVREAFKCESDECQLIERLITSTFVIGMHEQ